MNESGHNAAVLLPATAIDNIVTIVVPALLDTVEQIGGDWHTRVQLAEVRTEAWTTRLEVTHARWDDLGPYGFGESGRGRS